MDNFDFATAVMPIINSRKGLKVMSCDITEKRLYLKVVDEQLYRDIEIARGKGTTQVDTCAPVIILSNSEVGWGRLVVETGVYTAGCTNMCFYAEGGMRRTHLGARHALTENFDNEELFTSTTKNKTKEAMWLQVRDVVNAGFDEQHFAKRCERLSAAAQNKVAAKVQDLVEVTASNYGLNEIEADNVLKFFIEGGSMSQYGLHAAVTRTAEECSSYDRATELEYLGGKIVELPRQDWEALNNATPKAAKKAA